MKSTSLQAGTVGSKEDTVNTQFINELIIGEIDQPGKAIPKGLL